MAARISFDTKDSILPLPSAGYKGEGSETKLPKGMELGVVGEEEEEELPGGLDGDGVDDAPLPEQALLQRGHRLVHHERRPRRLWTARLRVPSQCKGVRGPTDDLGREVEEVGVCGEASKKGLRGLAGGGVGDAVGSEDGGGGLQLPHQLPHLAHCFVWPQ